MLVWQYDLVVGKQGVPTFSGRHLEVEDSDLCTSPHTVESDSMHIRLHSNVADDSAYRKLMNFMCDTGNKQTVHSYRLNISPATNTYEYKQRKELVAVEDGNCVTNLANRQRLIPKDAPVGVHINHGEFNVVLLSDSNIDDAEYLLQKRALRLLNSEKEMNEKYYAKVEAMLNKIKSDGKKSVGDILGLAKDVLSQAPSIYRENEDVIKSALEFALMFMGKKV